eukprot:1269752-Rhodomonas_salina.2
MTQWELSWYPGTSTRVPGYLVSRRKLRFRLFEGRDAMAGATNYFFVSERALSSSKIQAARGAKKRGLRAS